ncbi:hypothetical protein M5E86_14525 [Blautia wexlerae]|nr:hypothetical protein M5E86_14525 [Blautia wexlerae]
MTNLNSLFLSQAYNDCWDDYNRSLKLRSFPRWDYVILTASNERSRQKVSVNRLRTGRTSCREARSLLPSRTVMAGVSDPAGLRWRF